MKSKLAVVAMAVVLPIHAANAQAVAHLQTGGDKPPAVAQDSVSDDSPEEIAQDAARDLKDSRFYNRPGATRAQYDADWQQCRLIARGSRTPSGSVPYFYNPAVISPLAAGMGAGIGSLFGNLIVQGRQRRDNRRSCLMIKGWRLVEVPAASATRVGAMSDLERSAYFDTIVGAEKVDGQVTERASFVVPADANLKLDAPLAGSRVVYMGKKTDPAAPLQLAPGEAALVVAFRRPDEGSAGRSGTLTLARYDVAKRDLAYQPRDWKKLGDKTTYGLSIASKDKSAGYEVQVLRISAGDYVLSGSSVGKFPITNSFCFGAPMFHVAEGEVAYLGDLVPYLNAKLSTGDRLQALAYTAHLEEARTVLATKQPALAKAMKAAALRNRATYACSAITMDRWDLPGVEPLAEPEATITASAMP